MYAKSAIPYITEASPLDPPSKKGKVRKQLHEMIMNEVESCNLTALISRSADFYGPDTDKSVLAETAAKNLLKGKKAQAFGNINKIHTYTFTPDAYNQDWHVPTTKQKLTIKQWIEMIAEEIEVEPKIQIIPGWMLQMIGLFNSTIKEFPEMLYQNELDHIFDSSKFEKRFGIQATAPANGIKDILLLSEKECLR